MKTCLVIDDSEVVRKVACRIFENLQFEASEAESGQEALASCGKAMPDAILLDSHIPSMGTVEVPVLAAGARQRQASPWSSTAPPRTIRARSSAR